MADRTFSINIKPETIESIMLEPDKELMRDIPTSEKLIYELQEQELYKLSPESIALKPAYEKELLVADTEITHVDETVSLLNRHLDLFNSLREKIAADDEQTALHRRLQKFIGRWRGKFTDDEGNDYIDELLGVYFSGGDNDEVIITRESSSITENNLKETVDDNHSSQLFRLSRFAMDDFHRMSGLRRDITRLKRLMSLELRRSLRERSRLEKEIEEARADFENSEKSRLQSDENYAIVRGLLEEQLQAVDGAFSERDRILSEPLGLCYVRVSDLPMQIDYHETDLIAEPSAGSLPASCKTAAELPGRLEPFIELLADQPMSSWRQLRPYWRLLPKEWVVQPPVRPLLSYRQNISIMPPAFQVLMKSLPALTKRAIEPQHRLNLSLASRNLADEVTLEQLASSRNGHLRKRARRLQEDLEQATSCLLEQLFELPASLRYAWSRLAEEDLLNTDNPLSWPEFHVLANETTGLLLREIHAWLHLQLDTNAVPEARTAMRTLIRACLLHAVNDDPDELLTGKVVEFPEIIKPGVLFTANLNRIPQLSTMLKVYDGSQQLVAEAKVVDSKETQASIEIVSAYTSTPNAVAAWTVVSHKTQFHAGLD
ncbi:MAG: hypothetical protein P8Z78_00535 [Gammaproteobacteria bacterium]